MVSNVTLIYLDVIYDTMYWVMSRPICHLRALTERQEMSDDTPLTISVVEAGRKYFGLSRGASYQAAVRGEIPTLRIGRLLRVPIAAMDAMLASAKPKAVE